ncbi:hypothetical protein F5B20DRAFT_258693 [Whalleya microplaca]|nr:hypothetical protein F5B20DRAFT_258693 [Whalleya microplaca]
MVSTRSRSLLEGPEGPKVDYSDNHHPVDDYLSPDEEDRNKDNTMGIQDPNAEGEDENGAVAMAGDSKPADAFQPFEGANDFDPNYQFGFNEALGNEPLGGPDFEQQYDPNPNLPLDLPPTPPLGDAAFGGEIYGGPPVSSASHSAFTSSNTGMNVTAGQEDPFYTYPALNHGLPVGAAAATSAAAPDTSPSSFLSSSFPYPPSAAGERGEASMSATALGKRKEGPHHGGSGGQRKMQTIGASMEARRNRRSELASQFAPAAVPAIGRLSGRAFPSFSTAAATQTAPAVDMYSVFSSNSGGNSGGNFGGNYGSNYLDGSNSGSNFGSNFSSNYGGNSDSNFGGNYGGSSGGSSGGNFGSNHGSNYNGNYGGNYGGNFGSNLGSNYAGNYGDNYGSNYGASGMRTSQLGTFYSS